MTWFDKKIIYRNFNKYKSANNVDERLLQHLWDIETPQHVWHKQLLTIFFHFITLIMYLFTSAETCVVVAFGNALRPQVSGSATSFSVLYKYIERQPKDRFL